MDELSALAKRYPYHAEDRVISELCPGVAKRGYLTFDELLQVARWKSPRTVRLVQFNSDEYVEEITKIALSARQEETRIQVLTLLDGVQWPTASVILHFFHRDRYPILDFRALWSLSIEVPKVYTFWFWWDYVECCRSLVERAGLDMRTLDQALWQYSRENQGNQGSSSAERTKQ